MLIAKHIFCEVKMYIIVKVTLRMLISKYIFCEAIQKTLSIQLKRKEINVHECTPRSLTLSAPKVSAQYSRELETHIKSLVEC